MMVDDDDVKTYTMMVDDDDVKTYTMMYTMMMMMM